MARWAYRSSMVSAIILLSFLLLQTLYNGQYLRALILPLHTATDLQLSMTEQQTPLQVSSSSHTSQKSIIYNACPATPSNDFLSIAEATQIVAQFYAAYQKSVQNISAKNEIQRKENLYFSFQNIGRALYQHAVQSKKMLLSVQIGGMDGISNDPIYHMFGDRKSSGKLDHWMPIVFEPVAYNFNNLLNNYRTRYADQRSLTCYFLKQFAVSYDDTNEMGTCPFCRFDATKCPDRPDWLKYQVGSLDCEYSKKTFPAFNACWTKDLVPCGPLKQIVQDTMGTKEHVPITFLQIDIEGYEYTVIENLLSESNEPPVVLHYEEKVMASSDSRFNTTRVQSVRETLVAHGYKLFPKGEDMLALRLTTTTGADAESTESNS